MRKKNLSLLAMVAACAGLLLAGASCRKGGDGSVAPATEAAFTATSETHTGDGKTEMDGSHAVLWDHGDEIVVYNKVGDSYTFAATTVDPSSTTGFGNNTVPTAFYLDGPQYNAFYPSGATYDNGTGDWSWELPENQTYEEHGFAQDANPMAARSESNELRFMNVCGLLQLNLYGQGVKVRSITVTSGTDNLSGQGAVSWGKDGDGEEDVPVFEVNDGGSKSVTLTCPDVELSAEESNPTLFYIVLPAHALESGWFTIEVKDYRGKSLVEKGRRVRRRPPAYSAAG